jgi:hypothetical protein
LAAKYLLEEVVEHEPVAPREGLDETSDLVGVASTAAGRQRGELKADRPSLGALPEGRHKVGAELEAHAVVEERAGFGVGEPQVCCPDFDEFAARPQTCHRQWRVGTRGDGDGDLGREVLHHEVHGPMNVDVVDDVVVVEGYDGRPGLGVEVVDQADKHVLGRHRLVLKEGGGLCSEPRGVGRVLGVQGVLGVRGGGAGERGPGGRDEMRQETA